MPAIDEILKTAREAGASDVHITAGIPPKMRINGRLVTMEYPRLLPADTLEVLLNIMSEAQREKFEEKGEYDVSYSISDAGRYRVNAYRQRGTVALSFRLVDIVVKSTEELGIPAYVNALCEKRKGLVLVAGPSGSGKSTTLAAMLDRMNNQRDAHIITLEDPIEYLHQHKVSMVNQREIGWDSGSYADALQATLREDPDVILVGRIPDNETVRGMITAAETGHLVLAATDSDGAVSAIEHLVDGFAPQQQQQFRWQLANVLEAVVFQQLLPATQEQGRVAAFEVLHGNQAVRNLIREGKTQQIPAVMQANRKSGMITMEESIKQLYAEGKISKQVALQFLQEVLETRMS